VDLERTRQAGLELGVDPLGGASMPVWEAITDIHKLAVTVVNRAMDPTFSFMTVDHDGHIRTDPSSPSAMARVVALKDRFRVIVANDADADRHGIVAGSAGPLHPHHFLTLPLPPPPAHPPPPPQPS